MGGTGAWGMGAEPLERIPVCGAFEWHEDDSRVGSFQAKTSTAEGQYLRAWWTPSSLSSGSNQVPIARVMP